MPLIVKPLPHEERAAAKRDRVLVQQLERAVVLLRKAVTLHEVGETTGTLDDTREPLRKLRTGARSVAIHAIEEDRKHG